MQFSLPFNDIASGASINTFKTLVALLAADTAGLRIRLRSLSIGVSEDTPLDLAVGLQLTRVADISAGGAGTSDTTVATSAIAKKDAESADSPVSGKVDFVTSGVEPTTYESEPLWAIDFNRRGGVIKEWDAENAPVIHRDQLLGLLVAPRTAAAVRLSGVLEFETF